MMTAGEKDYIGARQKVLCIESATGVCSVAICSRDSVSQIRESGDERAHSKLLAVYVKEVLEAEGTGAAQLAAVAVSRGPGSYTGLRIGVSLAKGVAYGAGVPLISADTMESMYHSLMLTYPEYARQEDEIFFVPMIDARRMEVYHSVIGRHGSVIGEVEASVIDTSSFSGLLARGRVVFFGNGSDKCRELISHPNALFVADVFPSAAAMRIPVFRSLDAARFEDVAYFEPYYLKDFLATIPKKLIP
ncbi:MAG: tRNA (adenosine(37)-N6)-threonylcarbamoyltransferase complex dimerization subunit type 1 TsaB [Bacteroidetes bacterium]|nr:tRNA (adenosine(37)-N6)-threonylcarbamoyltransferase complex dimerization subunit type 1 TsaB [Bacteroidota bacterium]